MAVEDTEHTSTKGEWCVITWEIENDKKWEWYNYTMNRKIGSV